MKKQRSEGFALMDVLVAALVASIALFTMLGGVALAARSSRGVQDRLREVVRMENADAQGRQVAFLPAQLAR